jgi:hypothetical protein
VGWRNIVEKMHMTATLTKWYEEHGRHGIIAGGKAVNLPSKDHTLVLRADDVNHGLQHDLDKLGIAKTAREEKKRERDQKGQGRRDDEDVSRACARREAAAEYRSAYCDCSGCEAGRAGRGRVVRRLAANKRE